VSEQDAQPPNTRSGELAFAANSQGPAAVAGLVRQMSDQELSMLEPTHGGLINVCLCGLAALAAARVEKVKTIIRQAPSWPRQELRRMALAQFRSTI